MFLDQHIRLISVGSCDWRLGCWKFSFASQEWNEICSQSSL